MTYQYENKVTALDYWKLTMRRIYCSVAGVCNLVFTVAMILLSIRFWEASNDILQVLMLFGCLLFPVIQPIGIYMKAKVYIKAMPQDVHLVFDDAGLRVTMGNEKQRIPWKNIRVTKQSGMIIVFSDARHGYMLPNRVLGAEKESFFAYAKEKMTQGS